MHPSKWDPATWSAVAAWTVVFVYAIVAVFAWRQVKEARRLREHQARPFVVVDIEPGFAAYLVIENIGQTVARNIRIAFVPELSSTMSRPWAWEGSTLFTDGIPLLPPRKQIRLFFDSLNARFNSDLPRQYRTTVTYEGPTPRRRPFKDESVLDLSHYYGTSPPSDGIPELVKAVEDLKKEIHMWTDGISGLKVLTIDKEANERRQVRAWRRRQLQATHERDGLVAAVKEAVRWNLRRRDRH